MKTTLRMFLLLGLSLLLWTSSGWAFHQGAICRLKGSDFEGGGASVFGSARPFAWGVNYVYAEPTGKHSTMKATFQVYEPTREEQFLHLCARDDDSLRPCPIEVSLNGNVLFQGKNGFPKDSIEWFLFPIPEGTLEQGQNEIVVSNKASQGTLGMPPWFMVIRCIIGPKGIEHNVYPSIDEEFRIVLPGERKEIPEPYGQGEQEKGFKFRGIKGWMWTPEQYLAEIPFLAKWKMNFLMNCYTSMCDVEHYAWGHPDCNRWWEPLPDEKKAAYEKVVRTCQEQRINFCFSMNPNLCSKRFVDFNSEEDMTALWSHYEWMQGLGVKWFNISLDDISQGIDAEAHCKLINEILRRLREKDPDAQLIFTPTKYWGDGKDDPYLETIAKQLHPDVYLFWTGGQVVTEGITRKDADSYKEATAHRLFIWDNYPVNDKAHTLHLGPLIKRDPDLPEAVDGYMSNPMCPQNEINRIPTMTCADYAYNPIHYDPARSIGQAIMNLSETPSQREALKDLVELYAGMLIMGRPMTSYNSLLSRMDQMLESSHSHIIARPYLRHVQDVAVRMNKEFPQDFADARKTLTEDLQTLKIWYTARYGEEIE